MLPVIERASIYAFDHDYVSKKIICPKRNLIQISIDDQLHICPRSANICNRLSHDKIRKDKKGPKCNLIWISIDDQCIFALDQPISAIDQ